MMFFLMNGEKGDELGTSQLGICSVMWDHGTVLGKFGEPGFSQPHK
jgi:hypothetical protein